MTRPVRRLSLNATVRDAAEFLLCHGISGAPVVGPRGRVVGVFTLNNLARHLQERLVHLPALDPARERAHETGEGIPLHKGFHYEGVEDTRVSEFMTIGAVTVLPDAALPEIVRNMTSRKIHRVFVVSEENALLGVITSMDVLRWLEGRLAAEKPELNRASFGG